MSAKTSNPKPKPPAPSRGRRVARCLWRWLCRVGLLVLLLAGGFVLYLYQVGLPGFLKQRVIAQLRATGWEVQFSRLRWRGGLVAEDLHLRRTNAVAGPQIFVQEAQCRLNPAALKSFRLQVDAVRLHGGQLAWSLPGTNQSPSSLLLSRIAGELRFKTNDVWELDSFQASLLGVRVKLSGALDHASLVRDWKVPRRAPKTPGATEALWRRLTTIAYQCSGTGVPELTGTFHADARDLRHTLDASLRFTVPSVMSPWGSGTNLLLDARLVPPPDDTEPRMDVHLRGGNVRTRWGAAQGVEFKAALMPTMERLLPTNSTLTLELSGVETEWGKAGHVASRIQLHPHPTNAALMETELKISAAPLESRWYPAEDLRLTAQFAHPATNWRPASITGVLLSSGIYSPWADAAGGEIHFSGALSPADPARPRSAPAPWPAWVEQLSLEARASVKDIHSPDLESPELALTARWRAPDLRLTAAGELADGALAVQAGLNTATREVQFAGESSIDPVRLAPLLTTNAQRWLANYSWDVPPKVKAEGRLLLPAWTNRHPDWRGEVLPTASVLGHFQIGPCAYRGLALSSAQSPFWLSNQVFCMPEFKMTRPDGTLEGEYTSVPRTKDFHWRIKSNLDPKVARVFFEKENQRRTFDLLQFTAPPLVEAEIWGRWQDFSRLGVRGQVEATNLTFRGESIAHCSSALQYTNRVLTFINPQIERPNEKGAAPLITVDFARQKLYLTNAAGNLDPYAVTRAIGPKTAQALLPYRFASPPEVTVNGAVDLKKGRHEEDVHFQVVGGPFQWQRFNLPALRGEVDWQGKALTLTNVHGMMNGGQVLGNAHFDFVPNDRADFHFDLHAADLDLSLLMRDLSTSNKPNKLEGTLNGELHIRNANTRDPNTWQGHGWIRLRDGLIWDFPVFGVFSPILNTILPGLGNSRAREGAATFNITNSVVHSKDLEIRATAMRMRFEGAVDFERRVSGRMEAELLRDLPGVGYFVSKLLWPVTKLFEYKLNGTVHEPKAEPVYIVPKILLIPFHPVKTLKDLVTPEPAEDPEKKPATP